MTHPHEAPTEVLVRQPAITPLAAPSIDPPRPAPPPHRDPPQHRLVRDLCLGLVRLFYPEIRRTGRHVPGQGPVLVVANHPNGLLDPLVLRVALQRPIGFLAKSTLFGNALGRLVLSAFDALPVYRSRDGEDTARNQQTFALCRDRLTQHGWLAMFPEGTSHSDPSLKSLKTGAARIALSYVEQTRKRLEILPVGLLYEAKATFRTRVAATVGGPIDVLAFAHEHGTDFAAAQLLTTRIASALGDVTLQTDSDELWRGLLAVAAWTVGDDLAAREARARQLASAWRDLCHHDPERAAQVLDQTREFVRMLAAVGVVDPLRLEPHPHRPIRAVLPLLLGWPLALSGMLLGWLPYRLVRPLATKLARGETDVIGTLKLLLGLVTLLAADLLEAGLATAWAGWRVGLLVLVLAPLLEFCALRYGERWTLRRQALRAAWLRWTEAGVADELAARRRELVAVVEAALQEQARGP
jgi:glycerol-3-phosphate O-acyltransferase/dihydroxyacetone phosphate acyltransferase